MKSFYGIVVVILLVTSLSACGKVLSELRADGDAIVDNSTSAVSQTISTVGTIVKKLFSVGFAVYDLGKKAVDDGKDNIDTVVNLATGAGEAPPAVPSN